MAAVRHVGVVGAGLAGLSAALAAARAGLRVELFDEQADTRAPDAHIDLVPNLWRDLVGLGLGPTCVQRGFPYHGVDVVDGDGRLQFQLPTPHLAGPQWPAAVGMGYGELLAVLRHAALAHGVTLHTGLKVTDASDAGAIRTQDGGRHPVDLAVMASGSDSPAIAGQSARHMVEYWWPQSWCQAVLPRPTDLERATWITSTGPLRALLVPVSLRQAGLAVLMPEAQALTADGAREHWRLHSRWLHELTAAVEPGQWLARPVSFGVLDTPWHERGVLRIGRSAHRLTPFFGQAAAQAVEDGVVLGDLLRGGPTPEDLLQAFARRRTNRARQVHEVTALAAKGHMAPQSDTDLRALAAQLAPLVATPA